jgi:endonuclease YncB( thermonuclease family)
MTMGTCAIDGVCPVRRCLAWAATTVVGLAAIAVAGAAAAEPAISCAVLAGPARSVARVIDGETIALDDGTELRLIGALAPRALDADAEAGGWPSATVTTQVLRGLVLGRSIELGFTGQQPEQTDRYGRLQAHVFLVERDGPRWVQRELVAGGLARVYGASAGDLACVAQLLAVEQVARAASRGLWKEAAYQIRSADKVGELLHYRATFQIVEGRVVRVGLTSRTIYLNFDRDWRRGFSVSLRRDGAALLAAYATDPRGLEGHNVRVRGWIEQRGGVPVIDLSSAGAVEVLDDTSDPATQPQ